MLSLANIILDFPAQLFDIAEKEEEALHFTLQARFDATPHPSPLTPPLTHPHL